MCASLVDLTWNEEGWAVLKGLGRYRGYSLGVLLLGAVLGTACAEDEEIPEGAEAIGIAGDWVVTGRECPGECSDGDALTRIWVGAKAQFSDSLVRFGEEECRAPTYSAGIEIGDGMEGVAGWNGFMGISGGRLVEIRCSGERWQRPGSVVIVESDSVARAMWNGAVLRMSRPPGA